MFMLYCVVLGAMLLLLLCIAIWNIVIKYCVRWTVWLTLLVGRVLNYMIKVPWPKGQNPSLVQNDPSTPSAVLESAVSKQYSTWPDEQWKSIQRGRRQVALFTVATCGNIFRKGYVQKIEICSPPLSCQAVTSLYTRRFYYIIWCVHFTTDLRCGVRKSYRMDWTVINCKIPISGLS